MRISLIGPVVVSLIFAGSIITAEAGDSPVAQDEKSRERTHAPAASEFLVLPLRVYRLKSADVPAIDCRQLTDDDIRRIVAKVNVVWASAGVHWMLESIEDRSAENTGRFRLAAQIDKDDEDSQEKPANLARMPHTAFRRIIPESTRTTDGAFRVHYMHDFDVNGVYFGNREAMVKETAALRKVEGGIDEPLPRVTSHELGHALGLPHRQDTVNLMASGTTGTHLNDDEMQKARDVAASNPACLTLAKLEQELETTKDGARKTSIERAVRSIQTLAGKRIHPVPEFDFGAFDRAGKAESTKP